MSVAGNGATASSAAEDVSRQYQPEFSVMDGSSSSKVTVEYHDPSGLFPLIQEQLRARFPLRNLHWKSPNRPLRSIDSLHVDLVPSKDSVHIAGVTSPVIPSTDGSPSLNTANRTSGPSAENIRPLSKERRHQIPGLRQNPYLKLFLLRCDDSDTYKSTARKQLREWVKTHTPPSQSSSSASTQENHDAFEWMILHVVVPDTPAANQPRGSSSSTATPGEKEKVSATSRWTRGTTTILEKIRADFNISSKTAPDRVAQVRVQKDVVPPHMISSLPAVTSPAISESPQEQENAWNDVISKFKTLILLSFDLRVRQYEEDIREKDSQRALPGWNFCTFFMLKEGLARGFESVGLVEDALLGYDELSVGLDSIIRDQANEGIEGGATLSYTEDLFQQALEIYKRSQSDDRGRKEPQPHIHDAKPINSRKKNYRDLILSNNISVFDFRTYIFARQMSLLLRLGNVQSARADLAPKPQPRPSAPNRSASANDADSSTKRKDESEDLPSLAELCARALNFITFAGRVLREDLLQGAKAHEETLPQYLINNLVQSWTFAALQQVLEETSSLSLPVSKPTQDGLSGSSGKTKPFGKRNREQKLNFAEPKTMMHPARSSSLSMGRSSSADPPQSQTPPRAQVVYDIGQQDRSMPGQEGSTSSMKTGLQELAGARAQLYVVQRRILEHVGNSQGWAIGWAAILSPVSEKDFSEIDLDGKSDSEGTGTPDKELSKSTSPTIGLSAAAIVNAITSIEEFRGYYEALSDLIVKHYMAAGLVKAGESILGDLAALRYEVGDYAAAAMYFGRMASSFAESRWTLVEGTMLKLYAQCLKKLNRKDEYVRTLLDLLSKSAANKKTNRHGPTQTMSAIGVSENWLQDDKVETTGALSELVEYSAQLPYDRTVPMDHYFSDISVEPFIRHYDDKDGFQLRLQFRHVLEDEITVDKARVRLINATSAQAKEIWLESSDPIELKRGSCRIWLGSNVNTTGPYLVDKIVLHTNRIIFSYEPFNKSEATTPLGKLASVSALSLKAAKKARIFCFPRIEGFQARLYSSYFIHIGQQKSIEIECSSGWNDIQHAEIRLRSASAGLRLRTADATVTGGNVDIEDKKTPGVVALGGMEPETTVKIAIPYEIETDLPELWIKVEVEYFTAKGHFQYLSSFTIPIELALDVNVHDHFKNSSLYSKFNIKTASQIPLEIINVGLDGSDEYDVYSPAKAKSSFLVFPRQPVAMTYKITKKAGRPNKTTSSNPDTLELSVEYRCLDEDVLDRVGALFASAVESSPVSRIARLLIATFTDRVEHRVLPHQLEKIALVDKVDVGTFEDMGWSECLESLPQAAREDTQRWLQGWHETHNHILLASTTGLESPSPGMAPPSAHPPRRIIINVSIPQTHILHTASLSLVRPESPVSYSMAVAVAGQPLATELRIKHTRKWGSPANLSSLANISGPDEAIEFVYTVEANPDMWLIAGQRKAHFAAKENEELKVRIVLIPLQTGIALLPNVDIRPKISSKAEGDESGEKLTCETDYLSYGESVMVVPDVRSSTVGVGEMGSPRSAVWLESVSR